MVLNVLDWNLLTLFISILQINYADMLKRVEPLRNELLALESQASENKLKGDDVMRLIADLERSIAKYKEEYALLISQAQAIKADLSAVELKVCVIKHSLDTN